LERPLTATTGKPAAASFAANTAPTRPAPTTPTRGRTELFMGVAFRSSPAFGYQTIGRTQFRSQVQRRGPGCGQRHSRRTAPRRSHRRCVTVSGSPARGELAVQQPAEVFVADGEILLQPAEQPWGQHGCLGVALVDPFRGR